MVFVDRVVCNFCFDLVGQLFNRSAQAPDLIHDLGLPPHFVVCPDCLEASEVVHPLPLEVAQVGDVLCLSR